MVELLGYQKVQPYLVELSKGWTYWYFPCGLVSATAAERLTSSPCLLQHLLLCEERGRHWLARVTLVARFRNPISHMTWSIKWANVPNADFLSNITCPPRSTNWTTWQREQSLLWFSLQISKLRKFQSETLLQFLLQISKLSGPTPLGFLLQIVRVTIVQSSTLVTRYGYIRQCDYNLCLQ